MPFQVKIAEEATELVANTSLGSEASVKISAEAAKLLREKSFVENLSPQMQELWKAGKLRFKDALPSKSNNLPSLTLVQEPRNLSRQDLEKLYQTRAITYGKVPEEISSTADLEFGHIVDDQGRFQRVVVRNSDPLRDQREIAAYKIHYESPFTNEFPVTALRPQDNLLVQERFGKSLVRRFRPIDRRNGTDTTWSELDVDDIRDSYSYQDFLKNDKHFADQLEQTVAERLLLLDHDGHEWNIAARTVNGRSYLSNLDMTQLGQSQFPHPTPLLLDFRGRRISDATLTKIETFQNHFNSPNGRYFLRQEGIPSHCQTNMFRTADLLLARRHFPISSTQ